MSGQTETNTSIEQPKWTIRPMRHQDIDKCLSIWSRVELTEARQTVASVLSADPNGFYVAELEKTGEVIGMCAGPMTRADTAFMGFYAVEPEYQRIGIGRELWSKTIGRLDASINVGLYGVPSMSEKYKKSGFHIEDSTRMLIYESEPNDGGGESKLNIDLLKNINELVGCHLQVIDGKTSDFMLKKLIDYDQSVQKFSREKLLNLYLTGEDVPLTLAVVKDHSGSRAKFCTHPACDQHHVSQIAHGSDRKSSCCAKPSQEAIIEDEALSTTTQSSLSLSTTSNNNNNSTPGELHAKSISPVDIPSIVSSTTTDAQPPVTDSNNDFEILGYGCIRQDNNSGGMIGPIYADSSELCEVILRNLMERFKLKPGNIYSVMALSSNKQACKLLTKVGLNEMEQCSRMFTKFVPAASFSKIYYVHSPNFTLF